MHCNTKFKILCLFFVSRTENKGLANIYLIVKVLVPLPFAIILTNKNIKRFFNYFKASTDFIISAMTLISLSVAEDSRFSNTSLLFSESVNTNNL